MELAPKNVDQETINNQQQRKQHDTFNAYLMACYIRICNLVDLADTNASCIKKFNHRSGRSIRDYLYSSSARNANWSANVEIVVNENV